MDGCIRHTFERAEDNCRTCGLSFCGECLVYSFGPKRPPYCIPCAIAASGVRSTAGNPPASRRQLRAAAKERKARRRAGDEPVSEALATAMTEEPAPPTREETAVAPDLDASWLPTTASAG